MTRFDNFINALNDLREFCNRENIQHIRPTDHGGLSIVTQTLDAPKSDKQVSEKTRLLETKLEKEVPELSEFYRNETAGNCINLIPVGGDAE